MTTLLNHWSLGDQRVCVAFYLHEDENHNVQRSKINRSVEDLFGEGAEKLDFCALPSEEVVYEIRSPVVRDDDEYTREFFEKLHSLFTRTSEFSPHYTQIPVDGLGKVLPHE